MIGGPSLVAVNYLGLSLGFRATQFNLKAVTLRPQHYQTEVDDQFVGFFLNIESEDCTLFCGSYHEGLLKETKMVDID